MRLLSDASEYALRAVIWLAQGGAEPKKVRDIAEATRSAPGYLVKVLQGLAKAGILSAQRGTRGGFALIRDPAALSLLEVIDAVDPLKRIQCCPLGLTGHGQHLCPLHERIDKALAAVEVGFRESTIKDLLNDPDRVGPWCDGEGPAQSAVRQ